MQNSISVILVSYNSSAVILDALDSLPENLPHSNVIVVDNASSDNTKELIQKNFPSVKIIALEQNKGFGVANNIALAEVKTDFALLLNPDAILRDDCLQILHKTAEENPNAAIVAPLLYSDEKILESYKKSVFVREKNRSKFILPEGAICADFIPAAVWLVSMEKWRKIGGFDPNIFLFYEDDDFCLRARKMGYEIIFTPHATANHKEGKSTPSSAALQKFKHKNMLASRLYLEKKYRSRISAIKLALKIFPIIFAKNIFYLLSANCSKSAKYNGQMLAILSYFISPGFRRQAVL